MAYDWKDEVILVSISQGHPSLRELADQCSLSSVGSVQDRLDRLKKDGVLTWVKKEHRSLTLTELGKKYIEVNYGKD